MSQSIVTCEPMLAPLCPASPDSRQAGESPAAPAPGGAAPSVWETFSDGEVTTADSGCL